MTEFLEEFSADTAPPGNITFSALDQHMAGHSVIIAAEQLPIIVRHTREGLTGKDKLLAFKAATRVLMDSVGCDAHDQNCKYDGNLILGSFIAALITHPVPHIGKRLLKELRKITKKKGGAHLILLAPPTGHIAWMIAGPSIAGRA